MHQRLFIYILSLLLLANCSLFKIADDQEPRHHYRLWVGHKKLNLSYKKFTAAVNGEFARSLQNLGKGNGLLAFRESSLSEIKSSKTPDHIALLVFGTAAQFQKSIITEKGKVHENIKGRLFDTENSTYTNTLVVTPQTKIEWDTAYDVVGKNINWNVGKVTLTVYQRKTLVSDAQYYNELSHFIKYLPHPNIDSRIVLVRQEYFVVFDHYLISSRIKPLTFEYSYLVSNQIL